METVMVPDEHNRPAPRDRGKTGANSLLVNGFLSLVPLLISACATLAPIDDELDFSVAGRIGAVAGTTSASGDFLWRQYASGFDVEFWGPLGQGRTRLVAQGETLSVLTARGNRINDAEARDWIRRELLLDVPIRALSSWITGRPAPEWPATFTEADAFSQLGWQVEVATWGDWDDGRRPKKLIASRSDNRVTLVCREWTFGAP